MLNHAGRAPDLARYASALRAAVLSALLAPGPLLASPQLRYDREYPSIAYSTRTPTDRVAQLRDRVERGLVELEYDEKGGYLAALLDELDISVTSQMLVFTRTSFQANLISPQRPRAIYYNDDTYVAWVRGSDVIEISAIDPVMGGVFYTLGQDREAAGEFGRETDLCLQCHDSYGLTGGGVPRHLVGSMLPDENGQSVYHEGWRLTDDRTPFRVRWGGWYVTGTHGDLIHRGNAVVEAPAAPNEVDFGPTGNRTDLDGLVDATPYLSGHSDIVALMVLEHQVHVQNEITRVGYDVRAALHRDEEEGRPPAPGNSRASAATLQVVEDVTQPLVRAMLFVDEAALGARIDGTSAFAEDFVGRGPRDGQGRSLRELDLTGRLFRYPLSYMIYSSAFDGLPAEARAYVYSRIDAVLSGEDTSDEFSHLTEADRAAILEILRDTRPDFSEP